MLRIYVALLPNQIHTVEETSTNFRFIEDKITRLSVQADERRGFYFEINHSIKDREPLTLRDDIENITQITNREVTDDIAVIGAGCGNFACENGTVKISEAKGQSGKLEIFIVAKTVSDFNKVIDTLRGGELVKEGEELTPFEYLSKSMEVLSSNNKATLEQFQDAEDEVIVLREELDGIKSRNVYLEAELEKELALAKERNLEYVSIRSQSGTLASRAVVAEQQVSYIKDDLEKSEAHIKKLEDFIQQTVNYFEDFGDAPKGVPLTPHASQLITMISDSKKKTLWQMIWDK